MRGRRSPWALAGAALVLLGAAVMTGGMVLVPTDTGDAVEPAFVGRTRGSWIASTLVDGVPIVLAVAAAIAVLVTGRNTRIGGGIALGIAASFGPSAVVLALDLYGTDLTGAGLGEWLLLVGVSFVAVGGCVLLLERSRESPASPGATWLVGRSGGGAIPTSHS